MSLTPPDVPSSDLTLAGEQITVSYLADPLVTQGRFRLTNHGGSPVELSVAAAWLFIGRRRQTLGRVSLFDLDSDSPIDPERVLVESESIRTFLVGFPGVVYQQGMGEVVVGVRLADGAESIEAEAPVHLVHRVPRRPPG